MGYDLNAIVGPEHNRAQVSGRSLPAGACHTEQKIVLMQVLVYPTSPPPGSLSKQFDAHEAMRGLSTKLVEAIGCATSTLVCCEPNHAFAEAARRAFYDHHPLIIRPDDIWFCVAQGFATHVSLSSEALRSHFVAHGGKKGLEVSHRTSFLGRKIRGRSCSRNFRNRSL
ncbi:DUF4419 domain-containing protein [Rhizobium leucaenae]|uniref:Uncharacterized protein n=1 Tax=Rhizobium leucaenae TaxID=29450 RepID=A0A7W7A070_9HYPH|nr:DUF4419 domain-containing protein [Rhizobium leucaenae]MBB4571393.1 hypothetical protein [Rhizobium leucaenae]